MICKMNEMEMSDEMSWTLVDEINEIKSLGKYVTHYKTPRGTPRIPTIEFIVILVNS